MVNLKQKKGAVELSLNLIIMLIIGMVVLGLVIGFVNSLVNQGTQSFETQLGDNEKLKLEEVARCSDNLCMIPDPSIRVLKGGKQNVFIKVRAFAGDIGGDCPGNIRDCTGLGYSIKANDATSTGDADTITLSGPGFNIKNGKDEAQMYTLNVADEVSVGTYYLTMRLYDGDSENEVTKTITLEVE